QNSKLFRTEKARVAHVSQSEASGLPCQETGRRFCSHPINRFCAMTFGRGFRGGGRGRERGGEGRLGPKLTRACALFSLRRMSGLPFEILLALRYLRPKRTFVSVITLISVAGVALGVAVLIVVISVMSGFDKQLRDTILGFNAHLKIYKPNVGIVDYPHLMSQVASNKNVKGVAPYIISQVLMETTTNDHSSQVWDTAPYVRGIDPAAETNVTTLATNIADGKFDVSGHGILIGSVLATEYGIQVGDTVNISSP